MNSEHETDVEARLNSTEIRILGALIEKQATHPDTYPLTLNALVLACNQKTSREPVANLSPGQVGQSLRALEGRGFTRLVSGQSRRSLGAPVKKCWSWCRRRWC